MIETSKVHDTDESSVIHDADVRQNGSDKEQDSHYESGTMLHSCNEVQGLVNVHESVGNASLCSEFCIGKSGCNADTKTCPKDVDIKKPSELNPSVDKNARPEGCRVASNEESGEDGNIGERGDDNDDPLEPFVNNS